MKTKILRKNAKESNFKVKDSLLELEKDITELKDKELKDRGVKIK